MSDELKTDFSGDERNTVINFLRDEFGYDCELTDEHVLLTCQDLWRKGCHHLEHECYLNHCKDCGMDNWEERHPEYKDDAIAKRIDEIEKAIRAKAKADCEQRMLAKGYVKIECQQWSNGKCKTSHMMFLPGSIELKAAVADAIANFRKRIVGNFLELLRIDLNAKSGTIISLRADQGDEHEVWEIMK